jgi:hypothetical protein
MEEGNYKCYGCKETPCISPEICREKAKELIGKAMGAKTGGLYDQLIIKKMEQSRQYYTPDIEDLFIGYECEANLVSTAVSLLGEDVTKIEMLPIYERAVISSDPWGSFSISQALTCLNDSRLRTSYLTKEDIEKEGWKLTGKSIRLWFEKEGYFELPISPGHKVVKYILQLDLDYHGIHIEGFFGGESEGVLYEGLCPSINEFRKICKSLGIK